MRSFLPFLVCLAFVISTVEMLPAQEKAFFVANDGSDSNPGTVESPFATVAKAQEAARLFRRANPNTDAMVLIVLRGGTYFLDAPIRLTPDDSGTEASPTFFEAYEGEEVILSGGRRITGFRQVAPGRWETTVPGIAEGRWTFSQLYVNNRRCPRPTLPRTGMYTAARTAIPTLPPSGMYTIARALPPTQEGGHPDRFRYADDQFDPNWTNIDDIEVNTFHKWTMDHLRVREIDGEKKIVTFTGPTHSRDQAELGPTTNYRIENVYEALESPGQWYLNRKTGRLTVLSKEGFDMNRGLVIAPVLDRLVSIEGDLGADRYVEHVAFKGIIFAHTAWNTPPRGAGFPQADVGLDGAITMVAARNCAVADCIVRHTGCYGIDISNGCFGVAVSQCELFDLGAGGVKIGPTRLGNEPDEKKWCSQVSVSDCLIAHGGRIHAEGVGVWIGHANYCRIENNEIYDFYYSGVSVGWKWGPGFSPAHHNRIAWNHIHFIGQGVLNDMAGIYTLGESPGTELVGNLIHDVRRVNYGGWGLYYDESSRGIIAENNVVFRTQDGGFHQHYGLENTVRNNIIADAENGLIAISNLQKSGKLTFERNIFYMRGDQRVYEKDQIRDDTTFHANLYWREGGGEVRFFGFRTFDEWRKDKEPDAVVVDPLFRDPAQGDYRLANDSPAFQAITFAPIDMTRPGRKTKTDKTANLPVPLIAHPPGISATEIRKNLVLDEGFEDFAPNERYTDMSVESFVESVCRVTDKQAAAGKHSLEFRKGKDSQQSWQPHMYTHLNYDPGTLRCGFNLRVEKGTEMNWEIRDWRPGFGGQYRVGPVLNVRKDGSLVSQGKNLLTLPPETWVRIDVSCPTGPSIEKRHETQITVMLPGEEPRRFDVPCAEGFERATWLGFSTYGEPGTGFFIDDFQLRNEPATP